MDQNELKIITKLTGVSPDEIQLADDGFCSRGYIIDDGRIVFKFKKSPKISYKGEIKALNFINTLDLGIHTQKVGWVSPDDAYLGLHGITGQSLEKSPNYSRIAVGKQLAHALHQLHQAHPEGAEVISIEAEISAWQKRYQKSRSILKNYFSDTDIARLDDFFLNIAPEKLIQLGEKLVFSHGDLGEGNILIDKAGKVGIIDFSELCYLDESADFMDISDEKLRESLLDAYHADDVLREKVKLRVLLRPLFVFDIYAKRGDTSKVNQLIQQIKLLL